ncbi:MAG: excinuclease ABC subunit UvrC, partial [Gammaproteobacteria bacterium]|nr:excinuclease ABC subunit UvrC [Gammaproteobacteria bacterium]
MNDKIREKLKTLPDKPGSYQMLDNEGRIIYVGKAKNLKNRVRSYFVGAHNDKTTALVSKIDDFTYITTKNETEAFLLEISLIKEHEPFYNIALTDDKTYPYIEYTKEKDPKLIITRKLSKKNNRYFGPYPNVVEARKTLEILNKIYNIRRCNKVPKRTCIYYDLHECNAPCINDISKEYYDKTYQEIKSFLNGSDRSIINILKEEMAVYSSKMDFENAKRVRDYLIAIDETIKKENVILKDKISVDVYGIKYDESLISISILLIRNGIITLQKNEVFAYYFDLEDSIYTYVSKYIESNITPDLIFVDKEFEELFSN